MDIQAVNNDFIKIRNIADFEEDIRVLWKEAEETFHEHRLIMDCEPESLVRLMIAAKDFKLLGPFRVSFQIKPYKFPSLLQKGTFFLELVFNAFGYP